jgi:hypothetical protein
MRPTRVLFILKQRGHEYQGNTSPNTGQWQNRSFTGLQNSVRYIIDMLTLIGVESKAVAVADNNRIDGEIVAFQPTHVIVEALWVVPPKFDVLRPKHPGVVWNVRLHSEIPFIAQEGIAMNWIFEYQKRGVSVSTNSQRLQVALNAVTGKQIPYTPNYYPLSPLQDFNALPADNWLDVGCFGAIRPLKNQLSQAVAAIEFANQLNKQMRFHINADRVEGGALAVLHNIQGLFGHQTKHRLVEHGWLDTPSFLALLKTMDVAMQVSFSETFNICSADAAILNVPLVVSPEVGWASKVIQADPSDLNDIVAKLQVAWWGKAGGIQERNYQGLVAYDTSSEMVWPIALQQMAGMA